MRLWGTRQPRSLVADCDFQRRESAIRDGGRRGTGSPRLTNRPRASAEGLTGEPLTDEPLPANHRPRTADRRTATADRRTRPPEGPAAIVPRPPSCRTVRARRGTPARSLRVAQRRSTPQRRRGARPAPGGRHAAPQAGTQAAPQARAASGDASPPQADTASRHRKHAPYAGTQAHRKPTPQTSTASTRRKRGRKPTASRHRSGAVGGVEPACRRLDPAKGSIPTSRDRHHETRRRVSGRVTAAERGRDFRSLTDPLERPSWTFPSGSKSSRSPSCC